ncbi:hypothetical protein A3H10_02980 [Candidatus Uhrbacteria bacterium RIFCSPLOWO2_12_FULL_46_10]|uniref:Uncharacterized protein n=1 Tax=Candidatus Uhrbacteria bacterium RIFCSPLOWO2_01_FULL_47_25 TaxID=1802402 RepID=A0A1F7UZC2_9BACT|nr:MAG: hypothetical protein UX68_C0028G0005 [Parcubacteria group bacterium GW2011_GWA2_46_9]OGL59758.1 MAG: hypothetical protein A2752_03155 [Candidatus Uhrbacteria bacterium RIFCSPHIGHO2_01_FULL_46_23]OGL70554.1 MAG: hypothetical protein A3D60_03725 [Candidatus Uhrbacteria bacterium RIFCSPHIGHO2_02_FULL_47_29]OGL75810.1 MAG: hypothetical protein A3E96_02665 [Candidatus Uhrbacteria bacterium RIFCSPHIGHO2_12_FULL_46_13]OGL83087.1 MAG: hypothetical protein A2936_05230 [Candidatus Uhrbacteria bac
MKIFLLAIVLISEVFVLTTRPVRAQTGPLIMIKDKLEPIADVFNQPGLLGGSIDPQAALISRVVAIVNIFLGFFGLIFIILIFYGGYLWMTAAGNEQRVEEAQNVLRRAIIGVVIVLSAGVVTNTIILQVLDAVF